MSDTAPAPPTGSPDRTARATRQRAVAALTVALALTGLLALAVASGDGAVTAFDDTMTRVTRGWADPLAWTVAAAHVLGLVTAPIWSALAATVVVVVLLATRHRAAATLVALCGLSGVAVSEAVKTTMGRLRPPGSEEFEPDLEKSFPSGHAMVGIYLYMATGLVLIHLGRHLGSRWMELVGRALVVLGPLIGLSRIILGVHWPTDVIAGWALGSAVLLASALILWSPLHRGWTSQSSPAPPTPPAPPGAGTTRDPLAR